MQNLYIKIPDGANVVIDKLYENGHSAFVVGGCVRDFILEKEPHDWDICTDALPEQVMQIFGEKNVIPTGIKHGTVTVLIGNDNYEVTTYRIDGMYSDGRRPDNVEFTQNLIEDLSRRDFSINAMAYNDKIGLIDPFDGISDIKNRRICCVGDPGKRFGEDYLRILRAIRFSSTFGFIIVVIPFNTITTQTASVLREIVGEKNILENHSGFDFEDSKQGKLLQYASENWDIPIVVTTNVQFFESFFSNKPAKSRKLHNIVDSVIIFDEVQQFPANFLKPCIKCIESLAANFGARVVLSTATQPALESYFNTIKPREIIDDSESYVEPFRRCNIDNIGTIKAETLVKRIQKHKQCLCVVNEKDEAKSIYNAVKNGRCKNLYCLTTDITPYDRERLLRRIRQNLKDNEPCVVISTSLIESGVDVDFPCGYRELSSLDSILQTAGRVNRNGLRDCNSCTLFVFDGPQAEYHALKNGASKSQYDSMGDFGNRKSITKDILQKYDADSPKAIHEYFSRLYGYKGDGLDKFDIVKMANSKLIPFQDISQKFKIIDEDTVTVIISQTAEASELVGKIRNQTATKDDIRKVGKYAVSVRRSKYDKYLAASTEVLTTKVCNDVEEPDICNLVDMGLYTNIGVIFDAAA